MFIVACDSEFLEENPEGSLLEEGFLQGSNDINLAVTAMFSKFNLTAQYVEFETPTMGGDDAASHVGESSKLDFDIFQKNSQNIDMQFNWEQYYNLVAAANFVINNVDEATSATEEERLEAKGIASFMRAHAYFFLVRIWNEVPLVLDNRVNRNIELATPEQIYEVILNDLTFAEGVLPSSYSDYPNNVVPPTNGAVKGLLAGVHLAMAGYPLKNEGSYALAAQKAKEVIDNSGTWGYRLLGDFADLWIDQQHNDEIVYAAYFENEGNDIFGNNHNAKAANHTKPPGLGGWSSYFGQIGFFNRFPEGLEKRLHITSHLRIWRVRPSLGIKTKTFHFLILKR